MNRSWLRYLSVLGVLAAAPVVADSRSEELLQRMGKTIAELPAFVIDSDAYFDARLSEGLIVENTAQVTLRVKRPGSMRLTHVSADESKEVHFNEGTFSVLTLPQNLFAQTEVPGTIETAAEFAVDVLDLDVPLLDFLMEDPAAHLLAGGENSQYLGISLVRGDLSHHIVIREREVDVQLWIASEGPPLPVKIAISAKWEGGSPRSVGFLEWNTNPQLPDGELDFEPPDQAVRIRMLSDLEAEGE